MYRDRAVESIPEVGAVVEYNCARDQRLAVFGQGHLGQFPTHSEWEAIEDHQPAEGAIG